MRSRAPSPSAMASPSTRSPRSMHAPAGDSAGRAGHRPRDPALRPPGDGDRGRAPLDWYLPFIGSPALHSAIATVLRPLARRRWRPSSRAPRTWLLRDVHSPNLFWLPDARASRGSASSTSRTPCSARRPTTSPRSAWTPRVTVPEDAGAAPLRPLRQGTQGRRPCLRRRDLDARLCHHGRAAPDQDPRHLRPPRPRDGKPGSTCSIPRVRAYLDRALAHPVLSEVKLWYETFVFPQEPARWRVASAAAALQPAPCCSPPASARACAR